jgi:predicted nucleotidyltransferase
MMDSQNEVFGKVLTRLNERVKELDCLYRVEEALRDKDRDVEDVLTELLELIPPGWQHPTICEVRIVLEDKVFHRPDFKETEWSHSADIIIDNHVAGQIEVFYSQLIRMINDSQFLPEEFKLLNTISERVSNYIFSKRLRNTLAYIKTQSTEPLEDEALREMLPLGSDEHWKWRLKFARLLAERLDFKRYGVKAVYVIGSTKNAEAGPASDIDLIMHFTGDVQQRRELTAWVEGWGMALSEINYFRTGYQSNNMIDLHLITDEDIRKKTSYAVMIGSVNNGARLLREE